PPTIPFSRVIARVSEPRINETIFTMPAVPGPVLGPESSTPWWKRRTAAVAGVALTILLAATGLWLAYRPLARTPRPTTYPKPDTAQGLGRGLAPASPSAVRPAVRHRA